MRQAHEVSRWTNGFDFFVPFGMLDFMVVSELIRRGAWRISVGGLGFVLACLACSASNSSEAASADEGGGQPGAETDGEAGVGEAARSADAFWKVLEIEGEWIESYDTISELVNASDIAALCEFDRAEVEVAFQGDAEEDVVYQVVLTLRVVELFVGAGNPEEVRLSVILPRALGSEALEQQLATLNGQAPTEPFVVVTRDTETGTFRPINGYGIWASTSRTQIDAPLNPDPPLEDGVFVSEVRGMSSFDDLLNVMRAAN